MFMGLWIVVVLVTVVAAAGWSSTQGPSAATTQTSAREILDQRLARGELTAIEHAERRAALGTEPTPAAPPGARGRSPGSG